MTRKRNTFCAAGMAVCAALAAGGAGWAGPARGADLSGEALLRTGNFQEIIDRAKARVFPALIYIKPVVADFEEGEKKSVQVAGSGVIITPDGLAITNHHVVEKAIRVNCVLSDKTLLKAEVLGEDPDTDLALLRLDVPQEMLPLPFGEFGDSDALQEGDFVMAMGSPFGFSRSVSLGIISNTRRYLGFESQYKYNTWLQTDAAINPGNSGGPLVNIDGEVVGINTLGLTFGNDVGFSIPSNIVKDTAGRLERDGAPRRSQCGLKLQALKDFNTDTFLNAQQGVLISNVEKDSPAAEAGLREGDILLSINGEATDGEYVEELPRLHRMLADLPADIPTTFTLQRGSETLARALTPILKGSLEGEDFDCRRWNMTVKEINKHKNPDLYYYAKEGVYVQGVRYPGNAMESGLQRGDIILSVDNQAVRTLEDFRRIYEEIVNDAGRKKQALISVSRGGFRKWIALDYAKDYERGN